MNGCRIALVALIAMVANDAALAQATLLVLNKEESTLAVIDVATAKTTATIPTGDGPHEVEVSKDGRLAFVSNYGTANKPGNTLSVIDTATRKELRRVDLGDLGRPHGLSFSGKHLYFTSEAGRRIGRYDPAANRVDWKFDTGQEGTHMVLASRDSSRLYTSNMGSNTVSILDRGADGNWKQTLVTVGAGPEGMDEAPNVASGVVELWSAHSRDGKVSIVDAVRKQVVQTIDVQTKRSNRLKFTPDGKLVLISDLSAGELVIVDAQTRKLRTKLPLGRMPEGILMAPDGSSAYVAVAGENHIAVVDLKTLGVTRTIATGKGPDGMAWAP